MIGKLWRQIRALLGGVRDEDIRRELEFHVAMEADKRERAGMSAAEARRTATRDFGSPIRAHEDVRDVRGMTFWDALSQDIRFGVRTLRRSPGYTVAAVAILALGIGGNTAMFSVIDGVLIEPLPFRQGEQLVLIQQSAAASNLPDAFVAIPELFEYRKRLEAVRDLVEYHSMNFVLLDQGEPDRVDTGVVSANFFEMLGVTPALGRTFVPDDDRLGADAVLVLSHEYWQQKFGGDTHVIGRVLQMNNRPHTVVGVLPSFPQYPRANDVYMSTSACPFRSAAEQNIPALGNRAFAGLRVFGRLAPGATDAQATTEAATVATSFARDHPNDYRRAKGLAARTMRLGDQLVVGARPMLLALAGTTMLVLLIACANVANLTLARTVRRKRELAVRAALGAGRGRLVRQLATESLLVALAGGALGLFLAWASLDLLVSFVHRFTPRTEQIGFGAGVLAFTVGISILTGIVFGAAPGFAARRDVAAAVREGSAQGGSHRQRLRSGLVVAQVAVSFVLLVGAALLLESFQRLSAVPLGYSTDKVMTGAFYGNFSRVTTPADALRLNTQILDGLRAAPGVRAAALTSSVPLSTGIGPGHQAIEVDGRPSDTRAVDADPNIASDGYFGVLNIPVLAGRDFRASDTAETPPVAIINAAMAKYWEGADPIGRTFKRVGSPLPPLTIVGVVGNFRLYSVDGEVEPQYYTPITQPPFGGGRLLVRADGDPAALIPAIKSVVHGVDPQIPVEELQSIAQLRNVRLAAPGLTAGLLSIFAGVALLITLTGLAGVIATSVSQRTREFGLRMALGATRGSVLRQVVQQGLTLVAIGLAIGVAGAYAFSRLITRFLFATAATDLLAYACVMGLFAAAALIACAGPARRATTIDPLSALRSE